MQKLTLYHGSRSGLVGAIRPDKSRTACDFGQGFCMGDSPAQPRTLICDERHPVLYTVKLNLDGLNVYRFEPALVQAMTSLNIGNQYCAVSPRACSQVEIVRSKAFSANELRLLRQRQGNQRRTGAARAAQICREKRREGVGFDEVLQELFKEGVK